jgi:hypothetical protein
MNTIIFYTIVVIVILIVCFFLAKNVMNKKSNCKLVEGFDTSLTEHVHNRYGLTTQVTGTGTFTLPELNDYFYSAVKAIEPGRTDQCLTKYLHMYDLAILDTDLTYTVQPVSVSATNLNDCLNLNDEVILSAGGASVFKSIATYDTINNSILDNTIYVPHRNKFQSAPEFIDFGVKNKYNFYIKKYKYRLHQGAKDVLFTESDKTLSDLLYIVHLQGIWFKEFEKVSLYHFLLEIHFINYIKGGSVSLDVIPAVSKYINYFNTMMKLRIQIQKDGFLSKFNCKYFTYLFYAFNKGWSIFGDYINSVFTSEEKQILKNLFNDINCEGLYKLLILSLKNENCHILGEDEAAGEERLDDIFTGDNINVASEKFNKMFKLYLNFNLKHYFFYSDTDPATDGIRTCLDYNSLEAPADIEGRCISNISCVFNNNNKKCYPKPCLKEDGECDTVNEHCVYYPEYREVNGVYNERCYDKERVMYATHENDDADMFDLPQNFMTSVDSHLSDCQTQSDCKNTAITTCRFLDKNKQRHNPTEFKTCVSDELIDGANFENCFIKTNKYECDRSYGNGMSCFWQNDKCYKRDAPTEWKDPTHEDYGLEDMTDCKNFYSDYECPLNRCIWHGDKCIRKSSHPYKIQTTPAVVIDDTSITVPLDVNRVDCLLINNVNNANENDAKKECLHNKCHWDGVKNICMNNINRYCELHNNKDGCLDNSRHGLGNFDPLSQQNKCRWVIDETDTFPDNGENGFCLDTRMRQPCRLFNKNNCPVEDKVDNMGNVIRDSSHCKLDENDNCKNKNKGGLYLKDEYDACHYDYLNSGGTCSQNDCYLESIYGSEHYDRTTNPVNMVKKCSSRELLPCSTLTDEQCKNENITGDKCFMDTTGCTYPKTVNDIKRSLDELSSPINDSNIQSIETQLDGMQYILDENKKYYIKEIGEILGIISSAETNDSNNIEITIGNDHILNISIGDTMTIKGKDTVDYTVVVEKITTNLNNSIIEIKTFDVTTSLLLTNITGGGATWTLADPTLSLFGSYQHAQAITDSRKINDFYNHFI